LRFERQHETDRRVAKSEAHGELQYKTRDERKKRIGVRNAFALSFERGSRDV
jgi:hypothetical protein